MLGRVPTPEERLSRHPHKFQNFRFPKIRGPLVGAPKVRIIGFWGFHIVVSMHGYYLQTPAHPLMP